MTGESVIMKMTPHTQSKNLPFLSPLGLTLGLFSVLLLVPTDPPTLRGRKGESLVVVFLAVGP